MYSYTHGYNNMGEHMLRSFVMIYLVCIVGILIVAVGAYILKSYGLYKIAEKKGIGNAWAAWIPFVRTYYQGELAGQFKIGRREIKRPGIWMLLLPIVGNILGAAIILVAVIAVMFTAAAGYFAGGFILSGIVPGVVCFFGIVGVAVSVCIMVAEQVMKVFVNRAIYAKATEDSMALAHAAAGLFIPCYESICIFYYSRKYH